MTDDKGTEDKEIEIKINKLCPDFRKRRSTRGLIKKDGVHRDEKVFQYDKIKNKTVYLINSHFICFILHRSWKGELKSLRYIIFL